MSTVDPWFDETEIDWSPHRRAAIGPAPVPRRRRGPSAARVALVATLIFAAALGIAFVDLGRDARMGPPPPLRSPALVSADSSPGATLEAIAQCESRGDPTAVSADGAYRGKYQFDLATWRSVGGAGDPARAPESEQDRRARMLAAERGTAPWPVCRSVAG